MNKLKVSLVAGTLIIALGTAGCTSGNNITGSKEINNSSVTKELNKEEQETILKTLDKMLVNGESSTSEVKDFVNTSITNLEGENADELLFTYLAEISSYSTFLSEYLNQNSSVYDKWAETYDLNNLENIDKLEKGLYSGILYEVKNYPLKLQNDGEGFYAVIDYQAIANQYGANLSEDGKNYIDTLASHSINNIYDKSTQKFNLSEIISRLDQYSQMYDTTFSKHISKEWLMTYRSSLLTLFGLDHPKFIETKDGSNYFNKTVFEEIKSLANQATQERTKNDINYIVKVLEGTKLELTENAFNSCSNLIDFYNPYYLSYLPSPGESFSEEKYQELMGGLSQSEELVETNE